MRYKKVKFKNGLTLITVPVPSSRTATVLVAVRAGSNFESKDNNGISHFLEHMMFKGTEKRPTTLDIAEELDSIGGEYNAFTGKEWTGYYAKAGTSHLETVLDVISDIFINSKFEEGEIERERLVILEEMNMYQDTPLRYVDDLIEEVLYPSSPQGRKIIGEPDTVKSINRRKLINYFKKRYVAKNTSIIVAGNWDNKNIKRYIVKFFSNINTNKIKSHAIKVSETQNKPKVKIYYKKTDQSHLSIALRAYKTDHKNIPALKLLNIILGGNMSSRLFINIRERHGLCYYINSRIETYKNCGYLLIKAGVDNNRIGRAVNLIVQELKNVYNKGVSKKELERSKEYAKGRLDLSLETSHDLALWVGSQEMKRGYIKTPDTIINEINKVKLNDISRAAKDIIKSKKINIAVIGPYRNSLKFSKMLYV